MSPTERFELSARQRQVLQALCRHYVLTAQPVSSGALSRRYGIRWSSATIRGELAVLEQAGYVAQPHPAAGRAPTTAGLREFVASLERSRDPSDDHRRLVDLSIADAADARDGFASTTRVLAELAGCVAIGFVGAPRAEELTSLRLVPTQPGRALAVLGFRDGRCGMYRLDLGPEHAPRLAEIEHRLAALTVGRTLDEAREQLNELLGECEARVDDELRDVLRLGLLMCAAGLFDPLWLSVLGQPSLARDLARGWGREPMATERLGALLALLEDYQRLADLLCQILPVGPGLGAGEGDRASAGSAEIRLGLDMLGPDTAGFEPGGRQALELAERPGLSLVGCRLDDHPARGPDVPTTGAIAVLGSPSMDYESVIPLVEYAARALSARAGVRQDA